MALRDYLNVESPQELRGFVLQNGQAIAIVALDGKPLETWYFKADSLLTDNNTSVIRPNSIPADQPGRYILNTTSTDWNAVKNKPNFATVATTGNYNDLNNKLTAGTGVLLQNNELKVDDSKFLTVAQSNQNLNQIQTALDGKISSARTITVNGITQDLSANRDWEVGDISSNQTYNNPSFIGSLNWSKLTNKPTTFPPATHSHSIADVASLQSALDSKINTGATIPFSTISGAPAIPTDNNQLANGSGYITSVPPQSFASITGKPTTISGYGITDAYPLSGNPSGFLTTVPAQSWETITNKPSFSTVATTGSYNDLSNKLIQGDGVLIESNQIKIDNTKVLPTTRTITVNGVTQDLTTNRTWSVGDVSSTQVYNDPSFIGSLSWSKTTGKPTTLDGYGISDAYPLNGNPKGYLTAVPAQSWNSITGKPTTLSGYNITDAYPLTSNPSGFLTSVPAQSWNSITGKPTFSAVATTGKYADLLEAPIIPNNTNQLTNGAGFITAETDPTVPSHVKGITTTNLTTWNNKQDTVIAGSGILKTGNTIAIDDTSVMTVGNANASIASLNAQIAGKVPNSRILTINGVAQDLSADRSFTVTATTPARVFTNTAVKTINGTGVQLSTTRDASVSYSITHTIALTLVLTAGSSQVFLEISPNNSTWTTINQTGYSDGVAVAVALTKTTTGNLQGIVPAGYYIRLRGVVTGAGATTFTNGQEVLL